VRNLSKFIIAYKWKGILVEPVEHIFKKLKTNYANYSKQLIFENVAISDKIESKPFYTVKNRKKYPDEVSRISSFYLDVFEQVKNVYPDIEYELNEIECTTVEHLLSKNNIDKLQILLIDAEGHDWNIIKSVNFEKVKPNVVIFEHTNISLGDYQEAIEFFRKRQYNILIEERDTMAYKAI
jgi:FkbM family methyltransferase